MNLIKFYKRPEMPDSTLTRFYLSYFKVVFFVLSVKFLFKTFKLSVFIFLRDSNNEITKQLHLIYNAQYNFEINSYCSIMLIIFSSLLLFPIHHFFNISLLGISESAINKKNYSEVYFDFQSDYERTNPITRRKGFQKYLSKLKQNDYITEDEYNEMVRILSNSDVNILELYYRNNKDPEMKVQVNYRFDKNAIKSLLKNKKKEKGKGFTNYYKNQIKTFGLQQVMEVIENPENNEDSTDRSRAALFVGGEANRYRHGNKSGFSEDLAHYQHMTTAFKNDLMTTTVKKQLNLEDSLVEVGNNNNHVVQMENNIKKKEIDDKEKEKENFFKTFQNKKNNQVKRDYNLHSNIIMNQNKSKIGEENSLYGHGNEQIEDENIPSDFEDIKVVNLDDEDHYHHQNNQKKNKFELRNQSHMKIEEGDAFDEVIPSYNHDY